jgi:exosortase/archaeosortase family protein
MSGCRSPAGLHREARWPRLTPRIRGNTPRPVGHPSQRGDSRQQSEGPLLERGARRAGCVLDTPADHSFARAVLRQWNQLRASVPGPFLAALGLAGGFLIFVAWDQSHWWRIKEDYSFGWLVPLFVAFVVHDRWPRISVLLAECGAPESPRVSGAGKWLLRIVIGGSLAFGVLMFLLGSFYGAGGGTSQPGTLAITMGAAGILLPLLFINAPEPGSAANPPGDASQITGTGAAPVGLLGDPRVRLTGLFLFPVLVWLVSAPMVSAVESQLNLALLRKVVIVVASVFDVLGIPIEQQGNVLVLPNGSVGVEDACSGIRSLTGCLFAGSFLAAVFLDSLWKKIALVAAAMLLAFLTNLVRSLFLTAWAYNFGPASIDGTVHDVAGYAVLGLTVIGLLCLLPLLNLRLALPSESEAPPQAS